MLCRLFSSCYRQGLISSCSARASLVVEVGSGHAASAVVDVGSVVGALGLENTGSVAVHELSCSEACGIFPDQGLNLCLVHWQVDSLPLSHQGTPKIIL